MEKFFVAAEVRAGTHFFESVIGSHPDIHCYYEVLAGLESEKFHPFWLQRIREDNMNILPANRPKIFEDYLKDLCNRKPDIKAVGIDIKYGQFEWVPGIISALKGQDFKAIHIVRKNLLKQLISIALNDRKESLGRAAHGTKKVPPVRVTLHSDIAVDLKELKVLTDRFRKLLSDNFQYLEVCYEDFFDTPEMEAQTIAPDVLNRVYNFLNIQERRYDLRTDLRKTNPSRLDELIENYDEVVGWLTGTSWEYLLERFIEPEEVSVTFLIKEGERLYQKGDRQKALALFLKAIDLEPDCALGYNNVGALLWDSGDQDQAIKFFKRAMDLDRDSRVFFLNYREAIEKTTWDERPEHP